MERIDQQRLIAEILHDLGIDDDIIETITSLSKEEIKYTNK